MRRQSQCISRGEYPSIGLGKCPKCARSFEPGHSVLLWANHSVIDHTESGKLVCVTVYRCIQWKSKDVLIYSEAVIRKEDSPSRRLAGFTSYNAVSKLVMKIQ